VQMIGAVVAGVLLLNAVPHLVQGLCGRQHMTPLSRKSSALVNVIWGWINLVAGTLVASVSDWHTWGPGAWVGFCAGGIGISVYLAVFWSNPGARLPWHKD